MLILLYTVASCVLDTCSKTTNTGFSKKSADSVDCQFGMVIRFVAV